MASSKAQAGNFIIHLGGGREKEVRGGVGNDSFFLLDDNTLCKLDGYEGNDTLNFSRLSQDRVSGVTVSAITGTASLTPGSGPVRQQVFFTGMENITGTRGSDTLTGDEGDNILDGAGGSDNLDGGDGNDILRGTRGTFSGGPGTDFFQLRRILSDSGDPVVLIEDYRLGEDSQVSLEYDINEIESIAPEEGRHLLIRVSGGVRYRLTDFYASTQTGADNRTSAWHIRTRDGFSFRLKTAAAPPAGQPWPIPVFFHGIQQELVSLHLSGRKGSEGARVECSEIISGRLIQSRIQLPLLFDLQGTGIQRFWLHRKASGSSGLTEFSARPGEDGNVVLGYRIDEITDISVENEKHLLLSMQDGMKYRIRDFYTGADKKASWHFSTEDGFSFQLETTLPAGVTELKGIRVFFQGTAETDDKQVQTRVNLYARTWVSAARIETIRTETGKPDRVYNVWLSLLFDLELRARGSQGKVTGSARAERLTGKAGFTLRGNEGADSFLVEDSAGGTVTLNNEDRSHHPEQDILILPWALPETVLSVSGRDVLLSHTSEPDNHVRIQLSDFMSNAQFRHLRVRDAISATYRLEVTQLATTGAGGTGRSIAYLANGPLTMDDEDRLELMAATEGGLTLDGYSRRLSGDNLLSTVIIDHSSRGNTLTGTRDAHNYLRVSGGRNSLYGGRLADTLQGGSEHDWMAGGEGDDAYYVSNSATLDDLGGRDTLILTGVTGTAREALWLERIQNSLRICFKDNSSREVIISEYFNMGTDRKIEFLVMSEVGYSIASLVDSMVLVSDGNRVQKRDTQIQAPAASSCYRVIQPD